MTILLVVIFLINLFGLVLMKLDKIKAQKRQWRISERFLLGTAFCYGSYGIGLGMFWFRHKTRHWKFKIWVPICMLWQTILLAVLLWQFG